MTTPILPPFEPPYGPIPNITPFTYRDGLGYLQRLERLVKYINRVLIPFVEENYSDLAEAFTDSMNEVITQVNESLANQTIWVESEINDLITYVDNAVQSIITGSVEVSDPVVFGILSDKDTETWKIIDKDFASYVPVTRYGALGDGVNDDTVAFQTALAENAKVYVPNGTYVISDTITCDPSLGREIIGEGMNDTIIQMTDDTKFAFNFESPGTTDSPMTIRDVGIHAKYGVVARWDTSVDLHNDGGPTRGLRIFDCHFIGTFDPATDPDAGTTIKYSYQDLEPLGIGIRTPMTYGMEIAGCVVENQGIGLEMLGSVLALVHSNHFQHNARHIHDERITRHNLSGGFGTDNHYRGNDIIDGTRSGGVTFKRTFGAKFDHNYIEHIDRLGVSVSALVVDIEDTNSLMFKDNHINASGSFLKSQPFIRFRGSPATSISDNVGNNIIEGNYLTYFADVDEVTVDFDPHLNVKMPNMLYYRDNHLFPKVRMYNVIQGHDETHIWSPVSPNTGLGQIAGPSANENLFTLDASGEPVVDSSTTGVIRFNMRAQANQPGSERTIVTLDVDDNSIDANGRVYATIIVDGNNVFAGIIASGITKRGKVSVLVNHDGYINPQMQFAIGGFENIKLYGITIEPAVKPFTRQFNFTGSVNVAAGAIGTFTTTINGVKVGDVVHVDSPVAGEIFFTAKVTADNQVTIYAKNESAAQINVSTYPAIATITPMATF